MLDIGVIMGDFGDLHRFFLDFLVDWGRILGFNFVVNFMALLNPPDADNWTIHIE